MNGQSKDTGTIGHKTQDTIPSIWYFKNVRENRRDNHEWAIKRQW